MPKIIDHVEFLSQEIGPRPAGTEEEQQAALYIAEQFQEEAGLPAVIEDFSSVSNAHTPRVICCAVTLVFGLASMFLPVMGIPAIIATIISALLAVFEIMGRPVLSRLFARGVSQNIVAKYEPEVDQANKSSRRRKVILVARYDSGKVVPEYKKGFLGILPVLYKLVFGALIFIPILLIIRTVFFLHAVGVLAIVLNVLMGIALVLVAFPIIFAIAYKISGYNEAANSNASGVAVLLDVAKRLSRGGFGEGRSGAGSGVAGAMEFSGAASGVGGTVAGAGASGFDGASGVTIHGEDEARRQGVVPDGASLVYETDGNAGVPGAGGIAPAGTGGTPGTTGSTDEGLAAAKAAIAVLSGQPVPEQPIQPVQPIQSDAVMAGASAGATAGAVAGAVAGAGVVAGVAAAGVDVGQPTGRGMDALFGGGSQEPVNVQPVAGVTDSGAAENAPEMPYGVVARQPQGTSHHMNGQMQPGQQGFSGQSMAQSTGQSGGQPATQSVASSDFSGSSRDSSVPDWFKRGQEQAKKEPGSKAEVQRSRFADAFDAAVESANQQAQPQNSPNTRIEEQLAQMRSEIMETQAPQATREFAGDANVQPMPAQPMADQSQVGQSGQPGQSVQPMASQAAGQQPVQIDADGAAGAGSQATAKNQPVTGFVPTSAATAAATTGAPAAGAGADSTTAMPPIDVTQLGQDQASSQVQAGVVPLGTGEPAAAISGVPAVMPEETAASAEEAKPKRAPIRLPDIGVSAAEIPAVEIKQRAPLAQAEESSTEAAKGLLNMLPSIDLGAATEEQTGGAVSVAEASTQESVAFSGGQSSAEEAPSSVSSTGSFAALSSTGAFAPVGDELIADIAPDEVYVDDADDSVYEEDFTETGAFAGPDYVNMPKSRVGKFFGRLGGKNKQDDDVSPQEWLDVDDDFDAHTAGAERGGWESFQPEDEEEGWQGGAFSLKRKKKTKKDDAFDGYDDAQGDQGDDQGDDAFLEDANVVEGSDEDQPRTKRFRRGHKEQAEVVQEEPAASSTLPEESVQPVDALHSDQEGIYEFRYADIDTEVWLVALGSELANNSGMRAFVSEHEQELRGSIIVNLDSVGAGDLMFIEQEGVFKKAVASSRMKRYVRRAAQALGITVPSGTILWKESAASCASKAGLQAMSLAGMKDGKPAYFAEADDILENVEEDNLTRSSDLVMEILKSI